jgi:hypothetical protein
MSNSGQLRLERLVVLARHDSGALPRAVFSVVQQLETEIAWADTKPPNNTWASLGSVAAQYVNKLATLRGQQQPHHRWRRQYRD